MALLSKGEEYLDEQWFSRLREHSPSLVIGHFNSSRKKIEEQKQKFLTGELDRLDLRPQDIDMDVIEDSMRDLEQLWDDIDKNEDDEVIRESYNNIIKEELDKLRLIKAASESDQEEFNRLTKSVYGIPTEGPFRIIVHKIRKQLLHFDPQGNHEVEDMLQRLLETLPEDKFKKTGPLLPTKEIIADLKKSMEDELGELLSVVPKTKKMLNAQEIKQVFTDALRVVGAADWEVVIDKHKAVAITVDQSNKKIHVPARRRVRSKRLQGLVLHEIGTHIVRRVQGEQSIFQLLGTGLDGYIRGEEGIASMREQLLRGKIKVFAGTDKCLSMGLALGLDGKPRDFRETYEIMRDYFTIKNLIHGKDLPGAKERGAKKAWSHVIRIFRGTDGSAGTCLTKDIVYFQGNVELWKAVAKDPSIIKNFDLGKFDPTNAAHVKTLKDLGVIDS